MSNSKLIATGNELYAKRYFEASKTFSQWNHLTAADVQTLRYEPGFAGQQIYFYLNHPIRYVRLVGLVVDINLTRGGKHILIALDDSSGACIEIKAELRHSEQDGKGEYVSDTSVENLSVRVHFGLATVLIDGRVVEIGTVIKTKGTLDSFRDSRQLQLNRVWIMKDTNAESKAWAEVASWKRDVLSEPWVLTRNERDEIDAHEKSSEHKDHKRLKIKKLLDARRAEKEQRRRTKLEARRVAEEKEFNAGALVGSNTLPEQWPT